VCSPPNLTQGLDDQNPATMDQIGKLHMDIIVSALACDLTRVVSLQWGGEGGDAGFLPWLGFPENHHDLSHQASNPVAKGKLVQIGNFYASQVAYLIDKLKGVQEGTQTLFDRTLIVWLSGLGDGFTHSHDGLPFVLAGSLGGQLHPGQHIQANGLPQNNLHVSILNAMGVPATTFGNPAYCTGPLTGL
jgi:hypothetical protein